MSDRSISIAILGAGRWGVHLIRNFVRHPRTRVVAVVDPHPERLAEVRSRLDEDSSVLLATDWQQVEKLRVLDAVAIATPASTHYELILSALKRNCHVLAEKPLTLDPRQCVELADLARQRDRRLFVDHTYLFHPAVSAGKEAIARVGSLRYGYATRTHLGPVRGDVDALWDLAIHDLVIFNTWLGQTPVSARATGQIWLQPQMTEADAIARSLYPQGLADLVWATVTYGSGFQGCIHLCWSNPDKQRRLAVVGDRGTLIFDEMAREAPLTFKRGRLERRGDRWSPDDEGTEIIPVGTDEPLAQVCDRFVRWIDDPAAIATSDGAFAAKLVEILNALTLSLQEGGREVSIS
ncbi:MAG: gfo/Idh/MocA family oxidoreductase [Cyanobacteria bacterium J007]|nr:MAG: gfo/Idh/MocA family oxidoreductase [Cyanobacteria bacterium J007]